MARLHPGSSNRRHFRWLGWRAPVSACYFPISVSAWRRLVQFLTETDSDSAHRRARRGSGSVSVCPWPRSRWIFAAVVVIELARLIWAERIDEPSHGSHALCGDNGSLGPPISVLTHPGLTKTQVMPRTTSRISTAACRRCSKRRFAVVFCWILSSIRMVWPRPKPLPDIRCTGQSSLTSIPATKPQTRGFVAQQPPIFRRQVTRNAAAKQN
jgi:hypothetical protein